MEALPTIRMGFVSKLHRHNPRSSRRSSRLIFRPLSVLMRRLYSIADFYTTLGILCGLGNTAIDETLSRVDHGHTRQAVMQWSILFVLGISLKS